MGRRPDTEDYRSLFLADTPLIDLRAPKEFAQGAFPSAHSLPLMSDEERAEVGICYKQRGQAAAIELGHTLVRGAVREQRLVSWTEFTRQHSEGYLYCFRGGLRSQTVQRWLHEAGIDYPLVRGGYKAMRQYLLSELSRSIEAAELVLIAGKTGTGKTRVISQLPRSVDLEGLAGHRGSTFGQLLQPQPSQIDFENSLSICLLKLLAGQQRRIYLEDEGHLIGRCALPKALSERMRNAPMLVVERTLQQRIDVVIDDYIHDLGRRFRQKHGAVGPREHRAKLQHDLERIRKRLGGKRHQEISAIMDDAFAGQWATGDLAGHREWIARLLEGYYDPMYEYQLSKRAGPVMFRGDLAAVVARASDAQGD